jgi:methyl-accepting chemotaxis protein
LKDAATRFGSDNLSHRIPVSGDDELAQLGNAFNAMASSLQRSRADLRESEQRFRALVHHASDVFTVIGADAPRSTLGSSGSINAHNSSSTSHASDAQPTPPDQSRSDPPPQRLFR